MQTQTIFKAGNSEVVSIPRHLMSELGLKNGEKVSVYKHPEENIIAIKKVKSVGRKKVNKDSFKKWWNGFIKENGGILDELEVR